VTLVLHVVSTDGERRRLSAAPWPSSATDAAVSFGPGFLLVIVEMGCFLLAAVLLCLDDAVRAVTRALYQCQRRRAPATGPYKGKEVDLYSAYRQ